MEYTLYITPTDDTPYMTVPEGAVNHTPTGRPSTIDVRRDGKWGEILLRFRPVSPTSYRCYLVAMSADFEDGWLSKYSRSL